jgi:hypothetical protein
MRRRRRGHQQATHSHADRRHPKRNLHARCTIGTLPGLRGWARESSNYSSDTINGVSPVEPSGYWQTTV